MTGSVLKINVSPGGLPKRSVAWARVARQGIDGDAFAHPAIHGGPEQALLLIASETVDELVQAGYPLYYGALGENITMQGIQPKWMRAGQRYRLGPVLIELTRLRVPCRALDVYGESLKFELYDPAVKAGDFRSPKWARSGFYASVLETGEIRVGDPIALIEQFA